MGIIVQIIMFISKVIYLRLGVAERSAVVRRSCDRSGFLGPVPVGGHGSDRTAKSRRHCQAGEGKLSGVWPDGPFSISI